MLEAYIFIAEPTPPVVVAPPPPPPAPPSLDSYDGDEADDDIVSDIDPLDHRDAASIGSSSGSDGAMSDDIDHPSQHSAGMTLKRKRGQTDFDMMHSRQHICYSDELFEYFMAKDVDVPAFLLAPPPDFDVNEVIDTEGHTAIHWAAAMGDLKVIELLCKANANAYAINKRGETPLMRAVMFTNNYDRRSFPRLAETLRDTIFLIDKYGSTVFHHIAATTSSRNKLLAARYYNEVLLQKLTEVHSMDDIAHFLDMQDMNGDTALTISARNVAKKCVRTLLGYNASPDIPNRVGETADHLIITAEEMRKHGEYLRASSSSPFQPHHDEGHHPNTHPYLLQQPSGQSAAAAAAVNYAHASYVPQPHTSEAAIAATKKVIPLMAEMLEGLATAFDKELQDKEEDHNQAQRLLESSTREIEACRQASEETLAAFGSAENMNSQIDSLKADADVLATELLQALERTQYHELSECVREEEARVQVPESENTSTDPDDKEIMERLQAARELAAAQNERQELMDTIVRAYARSGAGGKMADYRRLIALSCSLLPDDVEKLLPEILKDLEAGGDANQLGGMVDGLV
jgi:transcription factor MBP1